MKGRVFEFTPSYNPKKRPSHEEPTQIALTMLPIGPGCSVGSLTYHNEKGCLFNTLRLQEAEFYFSPFL
jgi:uncharacterized OB-fold protein